MDSLYIPLNQTTADISPIFTIIVSICAIVSVFVAIKMLKATKKYTEVTEQIFLSSQRPYIGKSTSSIIFDENTFRIYLKVKLQNFGNVPAKRVDTLAQLFINGKLEPIPNLENKNQIFFPQQSHPINIILDHLDHKDLFYGIKNGKLPLEILTYIKYYGVTDKEYSTSETDIYNHKVSLFVKKLGEWT